MKLYPHQEIGVERLLANDTFGVYDVQGAGKTPIAAHAIVTSGLYPAMITVPAHLVLQWRDELIRWGIPPEEITECPRGSNPAKRLAALQSGTAVTLTTYNMWSNWTYLPAMVDARWQSFTFDESHRLRKGVKRNRKGTSAPEAVKWLRTRSRTVHGTVRTPIWQLTGTPLVRDATDLFPFLNLCDRIRFSSRRQFAQEWCYTSQGPYSLTVGKVRDPEAFQQMLSEFSIRRAWHQLPELAKLKRRDIPVPLALERADQLLHRMIKKQWRSAEGAPLESAASVTNELRKLTARTKVVAATEVIADTPGRFLALTWYRNTAHQLASRLRVQNKERPVAHIDGGASERERAVALNRYRSNPDCILVGTIASLKEGLNLQAGSQVLFAEQHYLSSDNDQAIGRVLRTGQTEPVRIYWLYCERTIDTRVKRIADNREANIVAALQDYLREDIEE